MQSSKCSSSVGKHFEVLREYREIQLCEKLESAHFGWGHLGRIVRNGCVQIGPEEKSPSQ